MTNLLLCTALALSMSPIAVVAQTVQLSAECPAQFVFPSSFQVVGAPVAGQSVVLSQTSQSWWGSGFSLLHVKVVGFSDPGLTLPSCGCLVRSSIDLVVAQVSMPTSTTWIHNTSLNLALPPGSTGAVFYTQGFSLVPWWLGHGCVDLGAGMQALQSYQVTIQ